MKKVRAASIEQIQADSETQKKEQSKLMANKKQIKRHESENSDQEKQIQIEKNRAKKTQKQNERNNESCNSKNQINCCSFVKQRAKA